MEIVVQTKEQKKLSSSWYYNLNIIKGFFMDIYEKNEHIISRAKLDTSLITRGR